MITANDKLIVLDDFQTDHTLPKYQKKVRRNGIVSKGDTLDLTQEEDLGDENMSEVNSFNNDFRVVNNVVWNPANNTTTFSTGGMIQLEPLKVKLEPVPGLRQRLAFWKKLEPAFEPEPEPPLSIEEFFKFVKNSTQELVVVKERAEGYERALVNAKKAGQTALVEKLIGGLNAYKMETQLIAIGLPKFIAEEDIVRFYKQSKKGLRLDYVRNFIRHIPGTITDKKARADELGLFDQYVVLHYDPQSKSYAETQAEKERKKDPILFGLMKDRRFLYVIGDWVDEVCDLTLDQLAEQIGKGAIQDLNPPGPPYRT